MNEKDADHFLGSADYFSPPPQKKSRTGYNPMLHLVAMFQIWN